MSTASKDISPYAVGPLLFTGLVGVFMVPYEIAALMDGWRLSAATAGLLGTAELAAMSISSIFIMRIAGSRSLRQIAAVGFAIAIAGEVSTSFIDHLWVLVSFRIMTGIGSGMVLAATSTSVAVTSNPNRVMGLGLTITNLLFFAAFLVTPRVLLHFGARDLFIGISLCFAAATASVLYIGGPPASAIPREKAYSRASLDRIKVSCLVLGLISLNIGLGAVWSFAERIGADIGLNADQIGSILAACPIAMIVGSATAGLMGNRFGDRWPILLGCIACGVACYATTTSTSLSGYAVGLLLFSFSDIFIGPFALAGIPSTLDPSGRLAAAANGLMWLTYSVGIAVGGFIADRASVKVIGTFGFCGCVVAGVTLACIARPRAKIGNSR